MVEIKKQLDNNDHYSGNNNIEYIVIHDTGNTTDSDEANANYFCSGTRNSSAHYFVDDDSITQLVEDFDGAWHVGDGKGQYGITNRNSLGIEMCRVNDTVSTITENNTIELVKAKMKEYNIPIEHIVRHYDASRKICPEAFSADNWTRWNDFKSKLVTNDHNLNIKNERIDFPMYVESYYLATNPDIRAAVQKEIITAKEHYELYGKAEGRRGFPELPSNFCEGVYLENNPDVKSAVTKGEYTCGAEHWLMLGWNENRKYNI
jgi:N-acetylmuramoyl-L-alanine amidase